MNSTNESRRFQTRARLGNGEDGHRPETLDSSTREVRKERLCVRCKRREAYGHVADALRAKGRYKEDEDYNSHFPQSAPFRLHAVDQEWKGDIPKLKEMTRHKRLETLEIMHLANDESVKRELDRINPERGIRLGLVS